VKTIAARHALDPWLVLATICQESAGNPHARREEPAFLVHYRPGIEKSIRAVADTPTRIRYLGWLQVYPIVFATSRGLMQVLAITAIERGMMLATPDALADPQIGVEAGCRLLRHLFDHLPSGETTPIIAALLRYNGGGNAAYASEVLAWQTAVLAAAASAA